MTSFADFLTRQMAAADKPKRAIDPEAALLRLRDAATRYQDADRGPRFPVGAVITPVSDAPVKGAGDPHLVIAARRFAPYALDGEHDVLGYGARYDTRVLCIRGDALVPFWVESAQFEPWTAPAPGRAATAEQIAAPATDAPA